MHERGIAQISLMTETSILLVEAVKTLGIERIDENIICSFKQKIAGKRKERTIEGNSRSKRVGV